MYINLTRKTVILHFTEVISRNGVIPEIPLATNVGPDAEMYKQPGLLDSLYEPDQIVPLFEIVLREARKYHRKSCMTYNDSGMEMLERYEEV